MPKLLLVEDDPSQSDPYRQLLEAQGYEVGIAAQGSRVVEIALRFLPDLFIVDLNLDNGMDGYSGYSVLEDLKQNDALKTVPIMVLTAVDLRDQDEIRALRLGADDVVRKSAEYGVVEARITRLLKRTNRS